MGYPSISIRDRSRLLTGGVFQAGQAVKRRGRAAAPLVAEFSPSLAVRREPLRFPPATLPAARLCVCPDAKGDAAHYPRGWRRGPLTPFPLGSRPRAPPGCTSTDSG